MPEPGWEPIFYGEPSRRMWDDINDARTKRELRLALYSVCCRLQELESRLERHFGKPQRYAGPTVTCGMSENGVG
jgi:hypothetical protein